MSGKFTISVKKIQYFFKKHRVYNSKMMKHYYAIVPHTIWYAQHLKVCLKYSSRYGIFRKEGLLGEFSSQEK